MSEPTDSGAVHAYSREAVEEYLRSVALERADLERAIADARGRAARATAAAERSTALERRVGAHIVGAHARVRVRRVDASETVARLRGEPIAPTPNADARPASHDDDTGYAPPSAWAVLPPRPQPAAEPGRSPWAPSGSDGDASDGDAQARHFTALPDRQAEDFFQQLRASMDDGVPLGPSMRPTWMATNG